MIHMRKISKFAAFAAMALSLCGCAKEFGADVLPGRRVYREFSARFADSPTRTILGGGNSVLWEAGDTINIFWASSDSSVIVEQGGPVVGISAEMDESDTTWFTAMYGAKSVVEKAEDGTSFTLCGVVPSEQDGLFHSAHVSVAHLSGKEELDSGELLFRNLTSLVKFAISRNDVVRAEFVSNDGSPINCGKDGYVSVSFEGDGRGRYPVASAVPGDNDCTSSIILNLDGAGTYYVSLLPQTLKEGFTLSCFDAAGQILSKVKYGKELKIERKAIYYVDLPVDLGSDGRANSYVVNAPGRYFFNASYKGNSKVRIGGTPASARVLWESYGTAEYNPYAPVIAAASLESRDGEYFVNFDTPASLKNGNAVLAVVDAAGTVLWSWHIWVCEGFEPGESAQRYKNGAYVMDRNLGATSPEPGKVESVGLFYQWGRKDPFIGPAGIRSEDRAECSVSPWPSSKMKDSETGTIKYSVEHPMVFIATEGLGDWQVDGDNDIWGGKSGKKTEYDPCPPGWRVPSGGEDGLWAASAGQSLPQKPDAINSGVDFAGVFTNTTETVWYPVSGYLRWVSGYMGGEGQYAHYLSADEYTSVVRARSLYINYNPGSLSLVVQTSSSSSKSVGGNIRCVKE